TNAFTGDETGDPYSGAGTGALESVPNAASLDSIKGLPAGDYTWDEGDGVVVDRSVTDELRYLMREFNHNYSQDTKAVFAVVRVDGVTPTKDGQIAVCSIPSGEFVFGEGIGESFKVEQTLYGGCANDEETNLLRAGGVYVLPLTNWQNTDTWRIYGDLDVLFEVDDTGLLHSHSRFSALNKYDGAETAVLYEDIAYLYERPVLTSRFAEYVSRGYYIDTAGAEIALIGPNGSWYEEDAPNFTAKLGEDGTITPANGAHNVFIPLAGMTTNEMNAAIAEIKEFVF
ncbi:MAG: hypothetical protein LBL15_06190, partial [Oscillospiraceae bacterium]|nr:hypothetical protein [Oscillospiraceae bacterium]